MNLRRITNTAVALTEAVPDLISDALPASQVAAAIERGSFRPAEDEAIAYWFSRYLTLRQDLWDVLQDVDDEVHVELKAIRSLQEWRFFVVGFAAACLLIRLDRFLVHEFALHTLMQRKLNEAFPEYRIKRKQYSAIFSAYTDASNMMRLNDAIKLVRKKRRKIRSLRQDEFVGDIVGQMPKLLAYLDISKRSYLKRALAYLRHKWRRRGASARHKTMFALFEVGGRLAAKLNPGKEKQVTPAVQEQLLEILQPGDIFVTRHRYALTNYFLPGTWPHAALYIGSEQQREGLGIKVSPPIAHRWRGAKCTLEALRDGVLFRPLTETLNVDAVVVVRPNLSHDGIRTGIERIVRHEGKLYNFDFDFFSSDRFVCTEIVYRAFDGLENVQIPLTDRAGRKTLTAEDILDLAIDTPMFDLVAVFGYPAEITRLMVGDSVADVVERSYR
ncbi:MAG: hypothetical protein HKN70_07235 [Gammaproteobacteria bacterium]|nr:hypothetical protein [Gammaproteobacteria bacterium]